VYARASTQSSELDAALCARGEFRVSSLTTGMGFAYSGRRIGVRRCKRSGKKQAATRLVASGSKGLGGAVALIQPGQATPLAPHPSPTTVTYFL
jgi:hypothetical protein